MIDIFLVYLKVFGNYMYSLMVGEDEKEVVEEIVFKVVYEIGLRMYMKKFEKVCYVVVGVLFWYCCMY